MSCVFSIDLFLIEGFLYELDVRTQNSSQEKEKMGQNL